MIEVDSADCLRELADIEKRILEAARVGVERAAKVAYRAARDTTLFGDRTGELRGTGREGRVRLVEPSRRAHMVVGSLGEEETEHRGARRGRIDDNADHRRPRRATRGSTSDSLRSGGGAGQNKRCGD